MTSPRLLWDIGTAYDFFISLHVLHHPSDFDVRGSWAAGVRARLPEPERETLEQSQSLGAVPFHWLYTLPDPKSGAAVLWSLGQIPPAERLPRLVLGPEYPGCEVEDIFRAVAARGSYSDEDVAAVRAAFECMENGKAIPAQKVADVLVLWANAEEFGERYLAALRAYHQAFFAEEERRIGPALQKALARAQEMAKTLELPDLLEELSEGVRLDLPPEVEEVVLVPSYWVTPLIFFGEADEARPMYVFGARPPDASLIPGETVPDALVRALKALSDPTRLRILHYLTEQPQSPAELSRRLRLRAPTVTHHLKTLRLAGLVQLTLSHGKEVRRYAARSEAVAAAFAALQGFLEEGGAASIEDELE
jgi:DNA-binding transcriptional ArsR family regulator